MPPNHSHSQPSSRKSHNAEENPYPYDTSVVRELLRQRRKTRAVKSCFPCRERKVRCDGTVPCSSCVRRGHEDLCLAPKSGENFSQQSPTILQNSDCRADSDPPGGQQTPSPGAEYVPTINGPSDGSSSAGLSAHVPESVLMQIQSGINSLSNRLQRMEDQIMTLKSELARQGSQMKKPVDARSPASASASTSAASTCRTWLTTERASFSKSSGRQFVEDCTGATIFVGGHSDPPVILGCRQPSSDILDASIFDQLAPKTYPFSNIWRPDIRLSEICQALPDDVDILRNVVYPFFPAVVTLDTFEASLFAFLERRPALGNDLDFKQNIDPSWLSLLFAVLACGVQFSDDQIKERDLRSKVFICCSFQCLRSENLFFTTNMDQVQAMVLIGHYLRNNLDANSAWILMGSTIRLAQSIGLHDDSVVVEPPLRADVPTQYQRQRLWWILVWQDTFLSLTYDRPPNVMGRRCSIPHAPRSEPGRSYAESIFHVCDIVLDEALKKNSGDSDEDILRTALRCKRRLEGVIPDAAPHMIDKAYCKTLHQHLERLALTFHVGYAICRSCRIYFETAAEDTPGNDSLFLDYSWRAVHVVECFLDLRRLSAHLCRFWAFVHNAVSCAVILKSAVTSGLLQDRSAHIRALIDRLIAILEKDEKESSWLDDDTNVRHFGPHTRALTALKETYLKGDGEKERDNSSSVSTGVPSMNGASSYIQTVNNA
ncbi:Zn(II)2Cys6 transcription factor [Paecilomyces variotii No. 5]|uniref:Zn(II)2Cys6 transcription factor n=1 Tax=Byssochlamys spectabilis (strain No. 5 / NBRC 109023) TaxID=1356009 RepID=V5GAQ4_BYSSN|nr:Zn(II)2Cys6 transcription factor [Paecilomyces variotii No. 5]